MTAATAFDQLATLYEALWSRTAIGISQRLAVWQRIDSLFKPGDRILDLGCGTGDDALHLESRDVQVYGVDVSAGMVAVARSRGVNAHRLAIENIADLNGEFDGAISNFGVLNCIEQLEHVASALGRLVRRGGYVAICVMSPFCLWETFYFLVHGNAGKAFRRLKRGKAASSIGIDVRYPSRRKLTQIFQSSFKLIRWYGVGLCVPPSYVRALSDRAVSRMAQIDGHIAHWPLLRGIADHRLFLFKRL